MRHLNKHACWQKCGRLVHNDKALFQNGWTDQDTKEARDIGMMNNIRS